MAALFKASQVRSCRATYWGTQFSLDCYFSSQSAGPQRSTDWLGPVSRPRQSPKVFPGTGSLRAGNRTAPQRFAVQPSRPVSRQSLRWSGPVALRLSGRHRAAFHQAASAKVLGRTGGSLRKPSECIQIKRHLHARESGGLCYVLHFSGSKSKLGLLES